VVPITTHFESEAPLHPALLEFLPAIFGRGWSDPAKIHSDSRRVAILLQEARENLAAHLGLKPTELFFLGEPALGFHLGISGLLASGSRLIYRATDRSEIYAVANFYQNQGGETVCLPMGLDGKSGLPKDFELSDRDLLVWQLCNGETGIISNPASMPQDFSGALFVDATTTPLLKLPSDWSTVLWDAKSWRGPAGFGILAISEASISPQKSHRTWRNPLPNIDNRSVPESFSIPLALGAAISLEHWLKERTASNEKILQISKKIREFITVEIPNVDIAGDLNNSLPDFLSISFLYVDAERLLTELDAKGFSVDSGSACNSNNMEPSHVLAAMGLLTQGNIRIRIRSDLEWDQVHSFLHVLKATVATLRSQN
jgi:cysteine desulfurase